MSSPEQLPQSGERGLEAAGNAAAERQAELLRSPEAAAEQSPERRAEAADTALREAHEASVSVEKPHAEADKGASSTHRVKPVNGKAVRAKAYKDILRHTQAEMPARQRAFSKVIHNPAVERTSAVVGSTVARPNAILFGALFAFLLSGSVYGIAKYYGYTLSGFEAIAAFIIGWAVGMIVDFIRLAVGKR